MNEDDIKRLAKDPDGLMTYEYLANHIGDDDLDLDSLADNLITVDRSGQLVVSTARYLAAIDSAAFADVIRRLADAAIEKDRERRYIADLLPSLWGADYEENAASLAASDDTFRRIYKRVTISDHL